MSDVQPQLLQATQSLLRQGEQIEYLGVLSHCIPKVAVFLPLIARQYAGHFLVAVTSERLIFFPTSFGLLGGVNAPSGRPTSIELADVQRVESFNPVVPYGHQAVRIILRQGLVHELMYRASMRGLDAHSAFAVGFAGSIARRVDAGTVTQRAPAERNAEAFKPRPAVFTFLLLLFGTLLSVGALFPLFLMVLGAPIEILALAFTMLFVGLPMLAGGIFLRRQRAAQMGAEQTPILEVLSRNRKRIAMGCGVVGVPVLLGGTALGVLLVVDHVRREDRRVRSEIEMRELQARHEAEAAVRNADEARFPAHSEWAPAGSFTLSALPGPIPSAAATRARLEALGFRVSEAPASRDAIVFAWSLVAVGDGGQTITLTASTGASDADTARWQQAGNIYAVRGPDEAVRERALGHLREARCSNFSLDRCAQLAGARRPERAGTGWTFQVGSGTYSIEHIRMPERGRRGPGRIRGPQCVASAILASNGWLCADVRLTPNPNDGMLNMPDRDQTWADWAIHTVMQP